MEQFRSKYEEFKKRNVEIIAIGQDSPEDFIKYWKEHDLPFIGCSDRDTDISGSYYQKVKILRFGRMPAEFIIDPEGVIRFVHYGESMSDIPEPNQLLNVIDKLKG